MSQMRYTYGSSLIFHQNFGDDAFYVYNLFNYDADDNNYSYRIFDVGNNINILDGVNKLMLVAHYTYGESIQLSEYYLINGLVYKFLNEAFVVCEPSKDLCEFLSDLIGSL